MIRVNQAGEHGAVQIYKGQLFVLKNTPLKDTLETMLGHEKAHLEKFNALIVQHKVRPTILSPLWHVGGFLLGAVTAALGEKAALACTVAVEEVIDEHYQEQKETLAHNALESTSSTMSRATSSAQLSHLQETIDHCQAEEVLHKEMALSLGAEQAPAYAILTGIVKTISKTAIWLSKRV